MRRHPVRKVLWLSALVAGLLGAFAAGVHYRKAKKYFVNVMRAAPVIARTRPLWHLQPARYDGTGVTINHTRDDDRVLLAGFFERGNEIRLIRRDGSIFRLLALRSPARAVC